ncbi:MAG: apolipoprotein N-acyltransferase, partial [Methylococcaceae bacterium]|nr:apolipoprotein N-acyltransferase [Methylococcaceae bacterium]
MTPARKRRLSQPALDLTAAAAGALFPFSFAPYSLALLAILCVALMAVLWRHSTPRRAALRGFLFGLGQFGTGVSWVYASMHDFGGADVGEGIALTGLLVAYLAAYGALAGYCARRLTGLGAGPWQTVVGAALAWVGADWLRGWMFTGFPWLQLGYTQVDTALGLGFAPLLGGYGVAFATALVAASVSIAAGFGWTRRDRLAALCFAAAVWLVAAGLARIQWTEPAGPAIAVALIQGNIGQAQKWQPEIQKATLQHYRDLTRLHFDARVVVWPETAVPAFYHQVKDRFLRDLAAEAVARGTDLLIGMPVMDQASGRYYNALVAVGSESGMYFKRHMVPFGEYLPIRSVFGFVAELLEIPMANFERGSDRQALLRAGGYPLAASICYEDGFGHESRFGLPEAAYVVNVTNDAWFGRSLEPDQHLQMARMRALESGRYLLRATNTGVTAIVSP